MRHDDMAAWGPRYRGEMNGRSNGGYERTNGGGYEREDRGYERDRGRWEGRGAWSGGEGRARSRSEDADAGYDEAPIVKVIEVVAQSPHSWEDAARRALAEASRTVRDIKSIYVKDMNAIVRDDRIVEFRLVAKISFALQSHSRQRREYA